MPEAPPPKFNSWAIVELMGHQRCAGKCTEENVAGANMLRVDVPEVVKKSRDYSQHPAPIMEKTIPAYSRYFSAASIYSITPCSEEVAKGAAQAHIAEPAVELTLPTRQLLAGTDDKCGRCDAEPCVCGGPDSPPYDEDDADDL